jgi:hypothetical protein
MLCRFDAHLRGMAVSILACPALASIQARLPIGHSIALVSAVVIRSTHFRSILDRGVEMRMDFNCVLSITIFLPPMTFPLSSISYM